MRGHNARERGGDQIKTWDRRGMMGSVEAICISIATLNIRLGRAGGLEAALQALQQGNVDLGIL